MRAHKWCTRRDRVKGVEVRGGISLRKGGGKRRAEILLPITHTFQPVHLVRAYTEDGRAALDDRRSIAQCQSDAYGSRAPLLHGSKAGTSARQSARENSPSSHTGISPLLFPPRSQCDGHAGVLAASMTLGLGLLRRGHAGNPTSVRILVG